MRIPRTVCLTLLPLFLAGCEDWEFGGFAPYHQDFHYEYPLSSGGNVELENLNGSVEISGWEKDSVDIDGTKFASREWLLSGVKIDIAHSADSVRIRTISPRTPGGSAGARYLIHVPRRAQLVSIVTTNGSIQVDSIQGPARLRSLNGRIQASQIEGRLDLETTNGSVELTGVTGDAAVHTLNGHINAEVRRGSFDARTTNGGIDARLMDADTKPVHLETTNGRIELTMDTAREVRANTTNASITVRLPGSAGASLRARTTNSSVRSDFDISVHGYMSKHSLEGAIGDGGPLVDLQTTNGAISVLKL